MENEGRKITKIAREVNKLVKKKMHYTGIGIAENDLIHIVRHNPGILQSEACKKLKEDKGAIARRVVTLEKKGFLIRKQDEKDKRKHYLYPTEKANDLNHTKEDIESTYYDWLLSQISPSERKQFLITLDKLYRMNKQESRLDFPHMEEL